MALHVSALHRKRWHPAAWLLGLISALGLLAWPLHQRPTRPPQDTPAASRAPDLFRATRGAMPDGMPLPEHQRSLADIRRVLWSGSFAGTHPVGNWCVTAGRLTPCPDLRDRFEYYINGLGQITLAEVRMLTEDEAIQANGPALAKAIMVVFDHYWDARNHRPEHPIDMANVDTWLPALQDMQRYRVQVMGEAWSQAFYAADDQQFMAVRQRALTGQTPPPTAHDPVPMPDGKLSADALRNVRAARYGDEVAQELAQLDDEQARFDQDVAKAQAEWQRLANSPELSDTARDGAIRSYIAQHFKAVDRRRAEALVKLPPR